jgi:endonuclease/exonuclease/phosphatase family metal-dependent hydrolase
MRSIITDLLAELPPPSQADRTEAAKGPSTQAENDRWMRDWVCMNALECVQPPTGAAQMDRALTVAAWNTERCKHVDESAAVLAGYKVDLVLATEMDWSCARSGQRHTTADLAGKLGLGYVFGVEFVELSLGDARETAEHAGETNVHGLHGNAVLSRFPIGRVALVPLDDGGQWYISDLKQGQRRIGGRNAIAAEIVAPFGSLWAVSVHFESESTPQTRADAAQRLLAGLATVAADAPMIIGGDFNVFELSRQDLTAAEMLEHPDRVEPTFRVFREAGFDWQDANAPGETTRLHAWQPRDRHLLKIDWLFVRGLGSENPWIAKALGTGGRVLSDHEPIGTTIKPKNVIPIGTRLRETDLFLRER